MGTQVISKEALKRSVVRSTKASARLEGRAVPSGFVRSVRIGQPLAEHQQRGWLHRLSAVVRRVHNNRRIAIS